MEEGKKLTSRPGNGEPVYQDCLRALDEFDTFEDDEDESSTAAFLGIGKRASYIALYGEDPLGQEGIYQLPVVKTNGPCSIAVAQTIYTRHLFHSEYWSVLQGKANGVVELCAKTQGIGGWHETVMVKRLRWLHTFIIMSSSSEECSEYKWHVRPTPKVALYARTPGTNRNHLPRIQQPEEATGMLKAGAMRDKAHPLTLNLPPDNIAMNAVLNPMTTITPMAASASMQNCNYVPPACCLSGNGIVFEDPSEKLAMTVQLPNTSVCCHETTEKWRNSSTARDSAVEDPACPVAIVQGVTNT
ncbi:hypothetical protein HO133_001364 [Letharia lupina]|uniref:Uncharacterized protein n=1 Tax=Letharia lupina TaxID=560253 RepID=A0A8H6CF74_9LECA|nr:uncharacterized protein HO133_001364 [Letharia lupina]KAF6222278.1 hypothetical protein HO133_001364 [Letharia lupina]